MTSTVAIVQAQETSSLASSLPAHDDAPSEVGPLPPTTTNLQRRDRTLHGALAGTGSSSEEALLGLASGVVFGLVSPMVGHPFDTVKTRMQADAQFQHAGFARTVREMYKLEGLRGFYRGFIPPLLGSMAFRGLLFSAYSGTYAACEHVPLLHEPIPFTGGLRTSVLVGALAAAVTRASIESPLDFIKVRSMIGKGTLHDVHHHHQAPAGLSSAALSARQQWIMSLQKFAASPVSTVRHLYHGFVPTLFRTIGLVGSFFIMVDYSIRYIPDVVNAPLIGPFFKGGVCATAAWVFAFPFESAKSVIQADTTGRYKQMRHATWVVMRQLYQERGIAQGLYRGFGPGASRSFIANGTSMMMYSWVQDAIRQRSR